MRQLALWQGELVPTTLRRSALATAAIFGLSGGLGASWVSRIPAIRDQLDTRPGPLGLALLCTGAGSLLTMPMTGRACHRWGSRRVIAWAAFGDCILIALLPHAPSVVVLGLLLLGYGGCYGAWDVAMNVHGSAVERAAGRAWMPRYHAAWSAGAIVGAGLGALAAQAGLSASLHLAIAAVVTFAGVLLGLRGFVDERAYVDPEDVPQTGRGSLRTLLTRRLVLIGLITLCGTTVEGAAADWLALHLRDDVKTTAAVAAAGYAVFSVAMAVTRFSGTWLTERLGRVGALRLAGLICAAGIVITATASVTAVALGGTVLWGLGTALVFPAAMSAGGESPGRASDSIAAVSTIGYGGFLLGPPLVGLLADATSLGHALLVLVFLAGGIVLLAPNARALTYDPPGPPTAASKAV
jgi:MFS family permease